METLENLKQADPSFIWTKARVPDYKDGTLIFSDPRDGAEFYVGVIEPSGDGYKWCSFKYSSIMYIISYGIELELDSAKKSVENSLIDAGILKSNQMV